MGENSEITSKNYLSLSKTLDKVRVGGIIAFVTSKGTLDKPNNSVRKYLAKKADLLGAIRLPNIAFKANAGTEVTADIIFLQKRDRTIITEDFNTSINAQHMESKRRELPPGATRPDWINLSQTEDGIPINSYFAQNPQMILGEMVMVSGQFGQEAVCRATSDSNATAMGDLKEKLAKAIQNILPPNKELLQLDNTLDNALEDMEISKRDTLPADPNVRNFSYTVVEDALYYRENSRMRPIEVGKVPETRIRGQIAIRDCARKLIDVQLNNGSGEKIKELQSELNTLYDDFSRKNGLISSFANKQAFEQDASYPLLCSLEVIDEQGKLERKAAMFTKRTIKQSHIIDSVDIASEALAVSIAEKACVDIGYMASLMGSSVKAETVVQDLEGIIFKDPLSDPNDLYVGWQTADEYLSSNVREKLSVARNAAESNPKLDINVRMLEQIQPKDLSAAEIDVRIGATWVDIKYYRQFMYELLQTPKYLQGSKVDIQYTAVTGEWNVKGKSEDGRGNARAYATYGTKRRNAYAIIDDSLNLRDVRIYDMKIDADGKEKRVLNSKETSLAQQKQEMIGEAFKDWIFKEPQRREDLCKTYNEIFNSTRPREYDGQHINFVGMTPELTLRKHQLNAVAHILYGHNTLLAHCVGAGKTFEMIAASMESKRLGLAQKSLFVVPNHLTEQWGGDFLRLYPGANILVATKKDFEPANRKKFCARIATGDFDAIIIGHSQFEKIPLSPERQKAILDTQLEEIITAIVDAKSNDGERYTIKQMEKSKKSIQTRLLKLMDETRKDNVVTFEELGVDRLFVDEAHSYKNLFLHTKMRNVAGIGQSEALKSSDMFAKCRYMDELTNGRGIVFATGTPVSNSMVELYTMMRYLQFDTLQKQGLGHFDSWAAAFGEKVTAIELAPEGTGFRMKTRFAKFFNLPELMSMWKESADIQTADMLNLPVPKAEYITVATKPSEYQKEMVLDLADRADMVRKSMVEPNIDNMLKITGDGRKLALDQRLKNDLLPDDPDSKINQCVSNVIDVWEESTEVKGAQMIFCDLSTPHYDGSFNVYDDIRNKLMEKGVPPEEISFIHDANTEIQKAELFAKVRKGQVRVLLGSTAKMGAGTNCQDRLVALHHTDCPWRPADIFQREGRILRQGNLNEIVKIFKYVTEGTFDAYNWSLVESKQKFIGQIMTSKNPARSADDVDATALSYAEVKALATGDKRIKEKMDLDTSVAKLKLLKANHTGQQYELEDKVVKYFPQEIKKSEERVDGLTADLKILQAHPIKDDSFSMTILGRLYTERKAAGEALISVCKTMDNPEEKHDLGHYRGFPMTLFVEESKFKISMKQCLSYTAELASDASGNITRINHSLDAIPKKLEENISRLETLRIELQGSKEEAARPFPKEIELIEKSARLNLLNAELDMSGKGDETFEPKDCESIEKSSIKSMLRQFEPSVSPINMGQKSRDSEVAI